MSRRPRASLRAHSIAATFVVAAVVASAHAHATAADLATAEALFGDARRLMAADRYPEACPKLEESERLDPSIGTELNLASCYQHVGHTASAWAMFLKVAGEARAAGQSARERVARERASALEPTLSRLVLVVKKDTAPPGLVVKRDGDFVGSAQWGTALPVDPGVHAISADAPGKKHWGANVSVPPAGQTVSVPVPSLDDEGARPPAQEPPPIHA